jgi:hypothetical protein
VNPFAVTTRRGRKFIEEIPLRLAQFVAFLLLAVVQVTAESESTPAHNPMAASAVNPVDPASLPPAPEPQKVVDKEVHSGHGNSRRRMWMSFGRQ